MLPLASIRTVLAIALITVCARAALCADYKGIMDFTCCGTVFRLRALHHSNKERAREKEIVLELYQTCPAKIPLEMMIPLHGSNVQAKICEPGSNQCEAATAAKIDLDSLSKNGRHGSGDFTAEFPNVGHREGKFTVKYHHRGPKIICD